jgi:hypothetical protein
MLALGLAKFLGLAESLVRAPVAIPAACLALDGLQAAVAAHSTTQKTVALARPRNDDAAVSPFQATA